MKQFVVALIVVLLEVSLYVGAKANYACPKHEVADPCVNPCPPTCDVPKPPVCNSLLCTKGCVCKQGLLRDERTKQCVPPHLCSKDCGEHEEWTICGAACTQTCQTLNDPKFCPSNQACKSGCVCRHGWIFDQGEKKCIPLEQCLQGLNKL